MPLIQKQRDHQNKEYNVFVQQRLAKTFFANLENGIHRLSRRKLCFQFTYILS
jgi:hypothetical protein